MDINNWNYLEGGEYPDFGEKWIDILLRDGKIEEAFQHKYYSSRFPLLWNHVGNKTDIIAWRYSLDQEQ